VKLTWEEVQDRLAPDGSIYTLKAIHPNEIDDPELSFFWGLARNKLAEFEHAEDHVVRVLDHRYSKANP
jgi:hypothetical protein